MSKRKYPSELNSRTIRVNIGDWQWLNSLAKKLDITVAQAFHKVITGLDHKATEPAQIPMPVATKPVFTVTPPVAFQSRPQPVLATNGHKAGVLVIKPKGGVIND